jgi:uncharacterized protein (DUF2236 family)
MSDGYFPRGSSILRRVHGERAVGLLYGQRALMLGALNPLAFIGTTQRSKAHNAPWRRLTHTAQMFEAVFFGTRAEADRALAFTRRLHERVVGGIPRAAGPYPAGTPYSALDPELMLWVVAPMYDSARVLYEALVRPLTADEREQLWQEYLLFGELFGMPRDAAPASAAELDVWWDDQMRSDGIFLTPAARAVGRSIGFKLPVPLAARPLMRGASLILTGSLPPAVRARYELSWSIVDECAYRALTRSARLGRPLVPSPVRRGSCTPFYGLIARTERARAAPLDGVRKARAPRAGGELLGDVGDRRRSS